MRELWPADCQGSAEAQRHIRPSCGQIRAHLAGPPIHLSTGSQESHRSALFISTLALIPRIDIFGLCKEYLTLEQRHLCQRGELWTRH